MKRRIVTILIGMALAGQASAQQGSNALSLDDCIDLALKNRSSIIAAHGREQLAAAGKRSALGAFLPRVSGTYSYNKGKDFAIDPPNGRQTGQTTILDTTTISGQTAIDAVSVTTFESFDEQDQGPNKRWNFDARMTAFDLGNFFDYFGARSDQMAAKLDVITAEHDLILAVKIAYYAHLAFIENLTVQEEAVKRAEEQLKLIESRYELGSASRSDVLKQKVQYGNDQLTLLEAQNSVTTSRTSLAYTIGIDTRQELKFSTSYELHEYNGSLEDAINYGQTNQPSLLSAERELEASGHAVKSAYSNYLPTVGVFYNWTDFTGTQAFPSVFDYSFKNYTYGFNISLNIFDGFLREGTVTRAKVRRNNARAFLADSRNLTASNIQTLYLDILKLREQKSVSTENVDAATEDLNITQERYNLGAASILDLLDAQVSLKRAQVQLIQSDFDLNTKVAELEKAMGKR